MSSEKIQQIARKYALQNAAQFSGKANGKAVIGKVIAAVKKDGISPKEIIPVVNKVIDQINALSVEDQIAELEEIAPELLQKEKKQRDFTLPKLPHAEQGKVITRFPPEPNGYLHIGHAKAAIVDYEYAKMYEGEFILRFDDTNPEHAELKFYEEQKKDLKWLGIEWDKEYNTSDNIKDHYKLAEQLINQGDAYICQCNAEEIKNGRYKKIECPCRSKPSEELLDLWKKLLSSNEKTGVILRLKGDMKSENTAMRDPTLFRVIDKKHPLQGDNYRVWPTYDFAGAIEDSVSGVTHPFRTKEYELRDQVYYYILELLHLRKPHLQEFSRLAIEGMPVSKRKIKPLIDQQLVFDYDDVRLPTLQGLERRGILPEAISQFVFSQGISKVESTVDFSIVEAFNRKVLDPQVKRFFFVENPVKLLVKNAPNKTVQLPLHPTQKLGHRTIKTESEFYVQQEDMKQLKKDDIFRLKGLYNIIVHDIGDEIKGSYQGEDIISDSIKIQWTTSDFLKMDIIVPGPLFIKDTYNKNSITTISGFAEKSISSVKHGEIIFTFWSLDSKIFYFTKICHQRDCDLIFSI